MLSVVTEYYQLLLSVVTEYYQLLLLVVNCMLSVVTQNQFVAGLFRLNGRSIQIGW